MVNALWPNDEPALVSCFADESAQRANIYDLRKDVVDPRMLDQFLTWTIPVPLRDQIYSGSLQTPLFFSGEQANELRKKQAGWNEGHPFVVIEIDYLLFSKSDNVDHDAKRMQAQCLAYALQAAGMPFTVLIDSGSKSVHAVVRLHDAWNDLYAFRNDTNRELTKLIEVLSLVLGEFDQGVFKFGGVYKLVRTPGAFRGFDQSRPQEILAVNATPWKKQDLFTWAYNQLRPEVYGEVIARPPKKPGVDKWHLRLNYFRSVLNDDINPGARGSHAAHLCKIISLAGVRNPERSYDGNITAPFLWWFMAAVLNMRTSGWFFSTAAEDQDNQKFRQYDYQDVLSSLQEQLEYEESNGKGAVTKELAAAIKPNRESIDNVLSKQKDLKKEEKEDLTRLLLKVFKLKFPPDKLKKISDSKGGSWIAYNNHTHCWEYVKRDHILICLKIIFPKFVFTNSQMVDFYANITIDPDYAIKDILNNDYATVFKNGTLYFYDENNNEPDVIFLEGHFDPQDYALKYIPYDYNQQARCPKFIAWLNDRVRDNDSVSILQEYAGYCFYPYNDYHYWLLLKGEGRDGKSTFIKTIEMALGENNCLPFNLAELSNIFTTSYIAGHMLAYDDEGSDGNSVRLNSTNSPTDILKKMVSGARLQTQRKGKDAIVEKTTCKFIIACNREPKWIASLDDGFWRRVIIVEWRYPVSSTGDIKNYAQRFFKDEIEGIINWAIEGWKRVTRKQDFTKAQLSELAKDSFRSGMDTSRSFANIYLQKTEDASLWCLRPIYECYCAATKEDGARPTTIDNFAKDLIRLGFKIVYNKGMPGHPDLRPLDYSSVKDSGRYPPAYIGIHCSYPTYKRQVAIGNPVNPTMNKTSSLPPPIHATTKD